VRNVGEFVLPERTADRIGHALALDADCAEQIAGEPPAAFSARSVVEDLCWLIACGIHPDDAADLLERVLASVGFDAAGIGPTDVVGGWRLRRTLHGPARAGLVADDPSSAFGSPPNAIDEAMVMTLDPSVRAMMLLMYRGAGVAGVLDRLITGRLRDKYADWSSRIAHDARSTVLSAVRETGIIIESCPTSNLRLAGMSSYRLLPLRRWFEAELNVSLNSDDPLIFGRSVSDEALAVMEFFGDDVLVQMAECSVRSCGRGKPPRSAKDLLDAADRL
jgi:hypothetical protein